LHRPRSELPASTREVQALHGAGRNVAHTFTGPAVSAAHTGILFEMASAAAVADAAFKNPLRVRFFIRAPCDR